MLSGILRPSYVANAEALISYHNAAVEIHRKLMNEYENVSNKKADFLPAVEVRTTDMYECDRVSVVRS